MNHIIDINQLSHSFSIDQVLNRINLSIKEGEIFGLLGPTGAGKTTLINILTGQLKQTKGSAKIFGKETSELIQKDYEAFGMVLDNSGLYKRLSCYDNLKLFTKIYNISLERIDKVLTNVGLLKAKNTLGGNLSKGMKQRLTLARAILHEPKILFLDEPTSGLDPSTIKEIHQLILDLKDQGTTICLTTHNMEEATKLCDNVGLLNNGNIIEYGQPKVICQKYNHQNNVVIQLMSGEMKTLVNSMKSADEIGNYFREGKIKTIHSTEPNLETVFIELTGRKFE